MIDTYAQRYSMDPNIVADRITQLDYYILKVKMAQEYIAQMFIQLKYYTPKK